MKLKPSLIKWLGQIDEVEKVVVRFKVLELDSAELENAGLVAALAQENEKYSYETVSAGKGMKFKFAKIKLDINVKEIIII